MFFKKKYLFRFTDKLFSRNPLRLIESLNLFPSLTIKIILTIFINKSFTSPEQFLSLVYLKNTKLDFMIRFTTFNITF